MKHNCPLLRSAVPLKESVYGLCLLEDEAISTRDAVILFVHNTMEERSPEDGGGYKPKGYGLAGGRLKPGELLAKGVEREVRQETSLSVTAVRELYFEHHLVVRNDGLTKHLSCEDAQFLAREEDPEFDPGSAVSQTLSHVFELSTNWADSGLRAAFILQKLFGGWSEGGALILEVDPGKAKRLGIVEAEAKQGKGQEIDALALLEASRLSASQAALGDPYKAHVRRIGKCLEKMHFGYR